MEKKVRLCLFSFILLIFSCDENEVVFEDSASLGIDFIQSSFIMNLNQSISSYPDSAFNFRNNQFNLSLSPKLYIGNIGYSESVNLSYAKIFIKSNKKKQITSKTFSIFRCKRFNSTKEFKEIK